MHSNVSVVVRMVEQPKERARIAVLNRIMAERDAGLTPYVERGDIAPSQWEHLKPAHVLIVEDYGRSQKLLSVFLRQRGYQVHAFGTGSDTLQWTAKNIPDAVVLDIRLPDMSGLDLHDILHASPSMEDVPMIFMSSFNDKRLAQTCLKHGAQAYFAKPLYFPYVAARLTRILGP